jgi:hypothetical protein
MHLSGAYAHLIHLLEHNNAARGVDAGALADGLLDNLAGGEPRVGKVVELREELLAGDLGGDLELGLLGVSYWQVTLYTVTHVVDVISADLVPTGVDAADARAQVGALVIRELARGEVDAVVNGVDALNELEVELEPEGLDLGVSLGEAEDSGNNLLAKVLVDETSRRELGLGEARDTKDLGEAALVVVVAVFSGVIDATDIDDNVERVD